MEGIEDLEAVEEEESFIPGGFFEEDDKEVKVGDGWWA